MERKQVDILFKKTVYVVHGLIFLLVTVIGIGPVFSIATPDPGGSYKVWTVMIVIFDLLVLVSAFIQLKIRKTWVLILSALGLVALFAVTLQYIYPYMLDFFVK